ncbi:GIY-YIG nuclease family protein [Algoriphagus jejuensis]|uniref:GIY-YIG nuclease family protein n=1 Tax=Algoriphagus jejuensis TaxID=419934 RepID=A0ABP3YEV8_9BACT
MRKGGAVYIMTNSHHTVLYTGVTNDLIRRVYEHRNNLDPTSFSARYNVNKLVYFESFHSIEEAISREKQIKGGSRKKKEDLIKSTNPDWRDLWDEIQNW